MLYLQICALIQTFDNSNLFVLEVEVGNALQISIRRFFARPS